jgi:hypothetical protein
MTQPLGKSMFSTVFKLRESELWQLKKAGLVQLVRLVRFLVVELIYLYLNSRFNISIIFMANYFFSERTSLSTVRRS